MDKKAMKAYQKAVYGNPNWVDGRINRLEYLYRIVLLYIGSVLALFFGGIGLGLGMRQSNVVAYIITGFFVLVYLSIVWQLMMTYVKRLHDLEWSGWLAVLIVFYPVADFFRNGVLSFIVLVVVGILSLILLFKRGTRGVNKYGKDPLVKGEE